MVAKSWCLVVAVLTGICGVEAVPIEVGSGRNAAGLYVEWKDGFSVGFVLRFEEDWIGGMDLIGRIAAETPLIYSTLPYAEGEFVNGFSYMDHSNEGYGGGEDWWHHWIREPGEDWTWGLGASDRVAADGAWDGWVYGRADIPEPAAIALLTVGLAFIRRRSSMPGAC